MNYLSGEVNSPIPIPKYYPSDIVSGKGAYVFDLSGKRYVDMWMGYGALFFGHADSDIVKLVRAAVNGGWFFSYQTKIEKDYSVVLNQIIPSAESVRYATTGSDAVAYAIRAARSYTKRTEILSIAGGYHGVHESMIESAGTVKGNSPTLIKFNDIDEAEKFITTRKYACIILEPVLANSGCTPPKAGYLKRLRELCDESGTILIFDEIVTGFRLGLGGAQSKFNVKPDISLFSKAIASGFPLSAICGKKLLLEQFIPTGQVFFAGTYNGNPLSLAVAMLVADKLKDDLIYKRVNSLGDRIRAAITTKINELSLDACVQGIDSMFTIAFGCRNFEAGLRAGNFNDSAYQVFIEVLAQEAILFPPLPTETIFLSACHEKVEDEIISKINFALEKVKATK